MGINIDNDELERMARQLADHQGTSTIEAIETALRRDLEHRGLKPRRNMTPEEREQQSQQTRAVIREIQERVAKLPILDPRPYREILYDEDGLPI